MCPSSDVRQQVQDLITVTTQADYTLVKIGGTFDDELHIEEQDDVLVQIGAVEAATRLLVDLTEVETIDSWGEGLVQDLAEDKVLSLGGRVAVAEDPARPEIAIGLKARLKEYEQARVMFFQSSEVAVGWLLGGGS